MANGWGGTMVLGVDDKTRQIRGIPLDELDAVESWVREICIDQVQPALDANIRKLELESAGGQLVPIVRIDVPRSLFVHRSPDGYYRRLGSSKREMVPDALARLFQERSQNRVIRFDESIVPGAEPADLHYALTQRFLRGEDADEPADQTLRKLHVVADDEDGRWRLTLAGVLLCHRAYAPDGPAGRRSADHSPGMPAVVGTAPRVPTD